MFARLQEVCQVIRAASEVRYLPIMAFLYVTSVIFILSLSQSSEAKGITFLKNCNVGMCTAHKEGALRIAIEYCNGKKWLTMQPGETTIISGKSCFDIKHNGLSRGDGYYMIDPDGGNENNAFKVFCDMTSFGGGWTMCYTTDSNVDIKTEISRKFPYGVDGYRADCNNIPFTEVMFVDEKSKQKAAFAKKGPAITFNGNYDKKANSYGLWSPHGVVSDKYKYQLLICDTSFYKGLHVSGYTGNCYKACNSWCGDTASPYFRTAAVTDKTYSGVAFNENGHSPKPKRLMSAGIR